MIEYYEFEKQLRDLARKADLSSLSRQDVLNEIVNIANEYLEKAERLELEMIIADQMNPENPRYDYLLPEAA
jgi:hypothetical protein